MSTTEGGGPRGMHAANGVKGRKRHIVTDTQDLVLQSSINAADI